MAATALSACSGSSGPTVLTGDAAGVPGADGSVATAETGRQLSKPAARQLEAALSANPGDLEAREKLVGYYYEQELLAPARDPQALATHAPTIARDGQLVWLIGHAPQLQLLGSEPMGQVQPKPDTTGYAAAAAAWTNQAAAAGATAQVKGNAGLFFAQSGDPRAMTLLQSAEAGDPAAAAWPDALASIYMGQARTGSPSAAASALTELENAWKRSGDSDHDPRLDEIAKVAAAAGADAKAQDYATRLLRAFPADRSQSPLTYGQEQHDGNMVLGLVALHRGDRSSAEGYLLKAGLSPGSPQMRISGPNLSLARALLVAGSKEVVLRYFDEVAKFWSDPQLYTWKAAVAAGSIPDFGNNLWN